MALKSYARYSVLMKKKSFIVSFVLLFLFIYLFKFESSSDFQFSPNEIPPFIFKDENVKDEHIQYLKSIFPIDVTKEEVNQWFSDINNSLLSKKDFLESIKDKKSCAIVGNSGNLKSSGNGELIDSHDIVLRMNAAETSGWEKDVGGKTSLRIFHADGITEKNMAESSIKIFKLINLLHIGALRHSLRQHQNAKVIIVNPDFIKYLNKEYFKRHNNWPSTGIVSILLSISFCKNVSVFGFGEDSQGRWDHYFDKQIVFPGQSFHSYDEEILVRETLAKLGKIKDFSFSRK